MPFNVVPTVADCQRAMEAQLGAPLPEGFLAAQVERVPCLGKARDTVGSGQHLDQNASPTLGACAQYQWTTWSSSTSAISRSRIVTADI